MSFEFPASGGRFFTTSTTWEAQFVPHYYQTWIDIKEHMLEKVTTNHIFSIFKT